jgi:hypothetical protein
MVIRFIRVFSSTTLTGDIINYVQFFLEENKTDLNGESNGINSIFHMILLFE